MEVRIHNTKTGEKYKVYIEGVKEGVYFAGIFVFIAERSQQDERTY